MDPGLLELIAAGRPDDDVAIIVRLHHAASLPQGLRLVSRFGDVATGRAARGALAAIHDNPSVASLKAPRVYAGERVNPFADRPSPVEPGLSEADPTPVDSDRRRPEMLEESGRGVVVAVIDWGLDFAHADFCRDDGSTRLLALWDQRARGNPVPYGYGQVHDRDAINRALGTRDAFASLGYRPSEGPVPCHGTHVMGIAAGNGRAGGPSGIAPDADLIFVHLGPGLGDLGNSIDLLEGIDFVVRAAGQRPLALNLSIGRHAGPHDGTLLVERAIDWLIVDRPGTAVVQSTGNYYSRNAHMQGRLREAQTARLPFELPHSDVHPATVEIWYKGADRHIAKAIAPDGSAVVAEPGRNAVLTDRGGEELGRLYHRLRDPNNGDNLIALILRPMAPAGHWAIEIAGADVIDGRWHAWIERNAACPNCQATFPPGLASRLTTTGSICNAMRTISVGAYDAHDPEQPLARFSSGGPTRDGRRKPLVTAPGVRILSVRSRQSVDELPGYVRMSGTSMAAPHVTGTVALMFETAGRQPIAEMRRALFATLSAPAAPTDSEEVGRWGYGILNIEAAVDAARQLRAGRQPVLVNAGGGNLPGPTPKLQEISIMGWKESDSPEGASVGPLVTDDERRWTKGRRATLPTPEQRVLSQFSDAELREMLDLPLQPPIAVASAENSADDPSAPPAATAVAPAAGFDPAGTADPIPAPEPVADQPIPPPPADPKALIDLAVNPQVSSTQIVGWPGARLAVPLLAGDVILRGTHQRRAKMVSRPQLQRQNQIGRRRGKPREPGFYAQVIGEDAFERIAGPDGLLLPDVVIVRSRGANELIESDPPVVPRPTIRQGSRGPAVGDAQTRLNAVHAQRVHGGGRGLDRCPLAVDGVFGADTRATTVAFQRTVFPGQPNQWDGVIGQRTWTALIAASESNSPEDRLPTRCPGLPREQAIDHFDFNSSDVLPRHQPQIIGIARCIIESQGTATPIHHLGLIGHTDPVGAPDDNVALGLRRAEAVRREILAAIVRVTGRPAPAGLVINVDSHGEREPLGDDALSRRVQVLGDFEFMPARPPPPPPAAAATIEFVLDDDDDHRVDGRAPVATALMFGLWDQAYGRPSGDVRNGAAEADNFVGGDARRFYIRVRDSSASGGTVTARWRTLKADGSDDDAPASRDITLTETAAGSKIFVSKALMLVVDRTDVNQTTHSGFTSGPTAGIRRRGQSDHRLRQAELEGSVRAEYSPAAGAAVDVTLPVFQRRPEARRRLSVRVINYGGHATPTQIRDHFARVNVRWAIVGLRVEPSTPVDRAIPAGVLDGSGSYPGAHDNAEEVAALADLIPNTPDNTVTVVFVRLNNGASAYVTTVERARSRLGDRFFVFMNPDDPPGDDSLAHEFHHLLFNRLDLPADASGAPDIALRPFYPFNTNPMASYAPVAPPDVRLYRRVQNRHSPDPNNDANNDNIINWLRRRRTLRFPLPLPGGPDPAPDATTGNTLTTVF